MRQVLTRGDAKACLKESLDQIDQFLKGFVCAVYNSRIALVGPLGFNHKNKLVFQLDIGFLQGVGRNRSTAGSVWDSHGGRA